MADESTPNRGRPRSAAARLRILTAAVELVQEGGLHAATMTAIAARAKVSKVTVYRWWSSPGAIVLEGLLERAHETIEAPPGVTAKEAMAHQVQALVDLYRNDETGSIIRAITSRSESDPRLREAFVKYWLGPRRDVAADILHRGIEDGEVRPDIDIEVSLDVLYAPIYFRLIYEHLPLDEDFAARIMDLYSGFVAVPARGVSEDAASGVVEARPGGAPDESLGEVSVRA